jgi:hypothetical protein
VVGAIIGLYNIIRSLMNLRSDSTEKAEAAGEEGAS